MKFCPRCGRQTDDYVRFCPGCGAAFPVMETMTPETGKKSAPKKTKKKKKSAAPWVILALVFVLLISGGVFWFLTNGLGADDSDGGRETDPEEPEVIAIAASQFAFRQNAFECGTGETSTLVFAVFGSDVDTTGLELYAQCGDDGEKITLTDDGRGADTVAGDNVYYGMASFDPQEEGTMTYTLKTKSEEYELRASRATVSFYTESTVYAEWAQFDDIAYDLDQMAAEFVMTDDPEASAEAYMEIVGQMKDYLNDLEDNGTIVSYSFEAPYFIINFPLGSSAYVFSPDGSELQAGGTSGGTAGSYTESFLADADLTMLLMLPYDGDLNSTPFIEAFDQITNANIGYAAVDCRRDGAVNANLLRSLQTYRVIAINTHGGSGSSGSFFAIGECAGQISNFDYANGYLVPYQGDRALVYPGFFEYYYEDGALNDCLIYLGCCHGADNSILANTLIRKGADAVLAFTNSVYSSYDGNMVRSLFTSLAEEDTDGKTRTVTAALSDAKAAHGDKDPTNTEWYNFWNKVEEEDRAELKIFQADSSDPFRLVRDGETGTVSGSVAAAADGTAVHYARITISGDSVNHTLYSDSTGAFTYSLPSGDYQITVTADDYCTLTFYTSIYTNYTTYLETFLLVGDEEGNGVAAGTVTSAMTGEGLSDVTLTIREDWNNTSEGPVAATVTTDSYGDYTVELPIGNYTVYCEKEGYVSNWFNIVVQSGTTENQNGSMNVDIDGDQFRIVLTWEENPRDVDIHIQGPKSSGGTFHTYWYDMSYEEGDLVICSLDVDDRYSYGPETITLITLNSEDPYYCYIHRYEGSGTLATSGAKVAVYCGAQLVASFSVPANGGSGDYWNVFAIVNGQIMLKNTITDSVDLNYAD